MADLQQSLGIFGSWGAFRERTRCYAIAKPEPLRTEHEQFRDAVLGKDSDIVTMRQGLNTVRVAEAMIESAKTGQVSVLEPV